MQPSHHPDRPESTRSTRMFACSTGRASTADVGNQRNGISNTTPDNTLPGPKPAEIAVLDTLHRKYKDADWAQTKAQRTAEQALELLKLEVEDTLIPLRRKCQARAELAFPHTDKKNRITRKNLHLPPDKRAID